MKNEAFITLINFINTQFTEKYENIQEITKAAVKIMPEIEKFIMNQMSEEQIDALNISCADELFNLVQSTGAGNFLSECAKDELWIEFSQQQMQE